MTRFMLDTNAVSIAVHGRSPMLDKKLGEVDGEAIAISAVTYGEIMYGLRWKPEAVKLAKGVSDFLREIVVLPWTEETGAVYGDLRASCAAPVLPCSRSTCSSRPMHSKPARCWFQPTAPSATCPG